MKKILLILMAAHLLLVPCFADVLPARRVESDAKAEQIVQERLEHLGASPSTAKVEVARLTPADVAYFAQSPDRLQPAGRLYWYEWVVGGAVLGVTFLTLYFKRLYYK